MMSSHAAQQRQEANEASLKDAPPTDAHGARDVHVVVAAYNEESVIARTVRELVEFFPNAIVVDDGSSDRTAARAGQAGAVVVRHPINLGQGAALQTGITYALQRRARYIATFDADGQHQAHDLIRMFDVLRSRNADIALGSRFLGDAEGLPMRRRLLLKAAVLFTNLATGTKLSDAHNGLRLMTAEAARKFRVTQNGMAHASEFIEQIHRLRLNYVEVPAHIRYTAYSLAKGQSNSGAVRILSDLVFSKLAQW
jgi:glycosyltransferase involved in cell wall biosynthesis